MNKAQRFADQTTKAGDRFGIPSDTYRRLCSLSASLGRWAEEEANGTIQRDEASGRPHRWVELKDGTHRDVGPIADREAGYLRAARRLVASYAGLGLYHQDDCRGVALYIYRLDDLRPGQDIDCVYSSIGHACHREP